MRNLKRVLALAMAMVMTLGMMVIGANAASYTDAGSVDPKYAEAVDVLSGMGVIWGTDTGALNPKDVLTRDQAAALIYRVVTGDVTDAKVAFYDYKSFDDVPEGKWFTGYVTYAANGGFIKGYGNGSFGPTDQVTGVQVLAIMLRAIGYGQNGEFEGAAWKDNTLTYANDLNLLDGIVASTDLDKGATRELVAQLLFNALTKANMVTYLTNTKSYIPYTITNNGVQEKVTLGKFVFGLTPDTKTDVWGRPSTGWKYNTGDKGTYYADSHTTYYVAISDCQIAVDMGLKKNDTVALYDNGVKTTTDINVLAQAKNNGGQGVLLEVYKDRIVRIDTYLAEVKDVIAEKKDAGDHVSVEAKLNLAVYFNGPVGAAPVTMTLKGNDYAKGDMILINVNEADGNYVQFDKISDYTVYPVQVAPSFVGAQSKILYNTDKHEIGGTTYDDAEHFYLDAAGLTQTENFTWFKDQYGNVIGSKALDRRSYAVLKDIVWKIGAPGYAQATLVYFDGTEATVEVASFDGLTHDFTAGEWPAVYTWNGWSNNANDDDAEPILGDARPQFPFVSSDTKYNAIYEGYALYEVYTNDDGTVNLNGADAFSPVKYDDDANLDNNSSLLLDVRSRKSISVTADTQFLVRNGDGTYSTYTRETLPEFEDNTEIFYTSKTDDNGNEIATRVYVKNGVIEAELGHHLFVTTSSYARIAGDEQTYEMKVVIDGVERIILTKGEIAEYLAANVGKLFHVTWEHNPYQAYYGFVKDVRLVNERVDDEPECDYLSGTTISYTGGSLIFGGNSYTVDGTTKIIGNNGVIDTTKGIWVVTDDIKSTHAAEVYVGTKLSSVTTPTVNGKYVGADGKDVILNGVPNAAGDTYTVTTPADVTSAEIRVYGANMNTVIEVDNDPYIVYSASKSSYGDAGEGSNLPITVWAEDGTTKKDYTIKLVQEKPTVIEDAVAYIRNGAQNAVLAEGVDVYFDIKDAAAHPVTLQNDNHYIYAKFILDVTELTNSDLKVVRFTGGASAVNQDAFNAAAATVVSVSGGVSVDYTINDLVSSTIVVVQLTDRTSGNPVYFAFSVNN